MSTGSGYISIIYCKTYFDLCYVDRMYDWWCCQYRPWLAGVVTVTTDRRRSWLTLSVPYRALGNGSRSSTHGIPKLGLTEYAYAGYIFDLNGPN